MREGDSTFRASARPRDLARLHGPVRRVRPPGGHHVRYPFLYSRTRVRPSTIVNLVALIIGAVVLAVALHQLGWMTLREAIVGIGSWFVVIAAIDVASVLCDAFAIHAFLRPHVEVSYWRVFAAQFSGLAINRLTPMNSFGEPVKVTMLVRYVPTEHAVSSVVMFNLTTTYVAVAVIVLGVPISFALLDLSTQLTLAVWAMVGVLIVGAVALALFVRTGPFTALIDLANKLGLGAERAARWRTTVAGIDDRLRSLGRLRAPGLQRGLVGVIASRVLFSLGTIVMLHAARIPLTPALVIASLSIGLLISWISNVVPLGIGVSEGSHYALYAVFAQHADTGVMFAMINRLRTILLALTGLAVMTIANLVHRRYHRPS